MKSDMKNEDKKRKTQIAEACFCSLSPDDITAGHICIFMRHYSTHTHTYNTQHTTIPMAFALVD